MISHKHFRATSAAALAVAYMGVGDCDSHFRLLGERSSAFSDCSNHIAVFDDLRSDVRWHDLVRRVVFSLSWRQPFGFRRHRLRRRRIFPPTNSPGTLRIFIIMKTKWQLSAMLLSVAMACTPALAWSQEPYPGEDHRAKQDAKNAGHEAKDAAKDTGRAVKHGTDKAYHSTKRHTKHAAHRTKNAVKGAAEGAREGAHDPQ